MNLQEYIDLRNKLIAIVDEAIQEGKWDDAGLYLKNVGKSLREIRQLIIDEMPLHEETTTAQDYLRKLAQEKEGHIKVYISIYQADSNNLERWRNTVKSLADYAISRPVYRAEEHIQAILRAKADVKREAYVVAYIKESAIISQYPGKQMTDRFGNELLTLKEGSVKLDNIVEFVHEGKRYFVDHGDFVL